MSTPNVSGLFYDLKFAYIFPIVGFMLFAINRRLSKQTRFDPLLWRLSVLFCSLLFICLITVLMYQDWGVFIYIWSKSPKWVATLSFITCVATLMALRGIYYWKLHPSLWTRDWLQDETTLNPNP